MSWRAAWETTKQVIYSFLNHRPFELAAALSFYTLLATAPLVLIIVSVTGLIFRENTVQNELIEQARRLIGNDGAAVLELVIENLSQPGQGVISMTIGIGTLLFGATTVFVQLQVALNEIWEIRVQPKNAIWAFIRDRLLSLAIVVTVLFLLLVSLIVSAVIAGASKYVEQWLPAVEWLIWLSNLGVSFAIIACLLAVVFKYLPDARIAWRDVWVGAIVTSIFFAVGKYLIGLYLGQASIGSSYGAAGSLVVLLIWTYYASLIVLFGAEITRVYTQRLGKPIVPSEHAERAE